MKKPTPNWAHALALLEPTVTGCVIYTIVSLLTLLGHTVATLQQYLNVPSHIGILPSLANAINVFLLHLLGPGIVNTLVLALVWALVGLAVYFILRVSTSFVMEMTQDMYQRRHYVYPDRTLDDYTGLRHLIRQLIFRLLLLFVLAVYCSWLIGFFLHGAIPPQTAFGRLLIRNQVLQSIVLFCGEWLSLYGLTILLRLFFWRRRLVP